MYLSDVTKARQARHMADVAREAKIAARSPSFKTTLGDSRIGVLNRSGKPVFYAYANGVEFQNPSETVVMQWLRKND